MMTKTERRKLIIDLYQKNKTTRDKTYAAEVAAIYARVALPPLPPPVVGDVAPYDEGYEVERC